MYLFSVTWIYIFSIKPFVFLVSFFDQHHNSFPSHYIYISSSHATSMDFPDSILSFVSLIHHSWQLFKTTSWVCTELVGRFLLVGQHWNVYVNGSRGECHLGRRPSFTSRVPRVLLVLLGLFLIRGRTAAVPWGAASRICSI